MKKNNLKISTLGIPRLGTCEVQKQFNIKSTTSYIYDALPKFVNTDTPIVPVVSELGTEMYEIPLDEAYNLNKDIIIDNSDIWSDVKNRSEAIKHQAKLIKSEHFNKILGTFINNTAAGVGPTASLYELLSNREINNSYHIVVNKVEFKKLIGTVGTDGKLVCSLIDDLYYYGDTPVLVADVNASALIDLNEVIIRECSTVVEVKDAETIRSGKRVYNIYADFGIGHVNTGNIYKIG